MATRKAKKTPKGSYLVDLPTMGGEWEHIETFKTKGAAEAFCAKAFCAKKGMINLITFVQEEED